MLCRDGGVSVHAAAVAAAGVGHHWTPMHVARDTWVTGTLQEAATAFGGFEAAAQDRTACSHRETYRGTESRGDCEVGR